MPALLLALFCLSSAVQPQGLRDAPASVVDFLPGEVLAPPLLAAPAEPRTGVRMEFGSSRLKLDIGAPLEFLHVRVGEAGDRIAAGALIFAYGLTTSSEGLRLQVSTVDGFFGGYLALFMPRREAEILVRLRLLHQSAHLVDGAYDRPAGGWEGGREPLPFTRDFGELTGQVVFRSEAGSLRTYLGGSYTTHLRPDDLGRFGVLAGFEAMVNAGRCLGEPFHPYAAQHVTFGGADAFRGTWAAEAGVRFGAPDQSGIRLYAGLITGPEIHGQYFAESRTSWGAGFAWDLR